VASRSAFGGGDQTYLRDVQYRDGRKLDARAHLHVTYATSSTSFPKFESELIEWRPDAVVLECGCGTGRFWLDGDVPRSLRVVLTDLSSGMVDEALDSARSVGFDAVGQTCDVQVLPFADGEFDVVLANHMLYHVPDPDRAISELARVLKPDGVLLAATNGYGHMREINEALGEVFGDHAEGLYEVFGIDTGERRLRECFRSIVWHAFDNDLVVDDPQAVIDYGLSFPPGESATETQRAEFAAAVRSRFVDGRLRIRTRAGVFVCREPR
jgi:SAM-dependent methyltransferase